MFTRKRSRSRESAVSQNTEEIIAADIEGRGEGDQGDISEIAGGLDESGIDQPFDYHYQITNNHPLGRLLLKNLSDLTNIAKKTNTKECEVNLKDFCYEFSSALDLEKEQLDERIRQNNEKFEKSLIEKELDSHKINASFTPPTEWGKHPTLTNLAKITAANKAFPGMSKFRGHPREGFLNIIEFFTVLRNAQEQCKLSEKEFIEKMIIASTGEAHEIISYCREQAEGVSDIYHSLLMRFDDRISVEEAKSRLLSFKATKSMNLARVQSQIMIYANRASAQYPVGPSRQNYYNLESCQALIKALPTNSQNIATTTYNSLTARLQEAPTYSVFTRALNNHRTIMDKDIRQYGVEPNRFNAGRYNNNNKRPRNSPQSYTRNTRKPNYSAYSVTLSSAGAEASGRHLIKISQSLRIITLAIIIMATSKNSTIITRVPTLPPLIQTGEVSKGAEAAASREAISGKITLKEENPRVGRPIILTEIKGEALQITELVSDQIIIIRVAHYADTKITKLLIVETYGMTVEI